MRNFLLLLAILVLGFLWTDRSLDWAVSEYQGGAVNVLWYWVVVFMVMGPTMLFFNVV